MTKATILLAFFGFSNLFAANWTGDLTITALHAESNSNLIVVTTEGSPQYVTGCVVNQWIIDPSNDLYQNRVYSMLLTAISTGQKVNFWYLDACGSWGYHKASASRINR